MSLKKNLLFILLYLCLYSGSWANQITSPLYFLSSKEIVAKLNIGLNNSHFKTIDYSTLKTHQFKEYSYLNLDAKYGLNDRISINYGFDIDFDREIYNESKNSKMTNIYLGATGRLVDCEINKLDAFFNIGRDSNSKYLPGIYNIKQNYLDFGIKYGLDFDSYDIALSIGGKFFDSYKYSNDLKIEKEFDFYTRLENQIILSDRFNLGIDLFYSYNAKGSFNDDRNQTFSNEYGIFTNINYSLNSNNYIGIYYNIKNSDLRIYDNAKNLVEYSAGIKAITKFGPSY